MMAIILMKFNIVLKELLKQHIYDEEMSEIKDEIQEAQKYYTQKRAKKHEND